MDRRRPKDSTVLSVKRDLVQGGRAVYLRPHLKEFLTFLSTHFDVAVWSSATMVTIDEMAPVVLGAHVVSQLKFIMSREHCVAAPTEGKGYDTVKPLQKLSELYPQYNATNTFVLDDSHHKSRDNLQNVYCPVPYQAENAATDTELGSLEKILMHLLLANKYGSWLAISAVVTSPLQSRNSCITIRLPHAASKFATKCRQTVGVRSTETVSVKKCQRRTDEFYVFAITSERNDARVCVVRTHMSVTQAPQSAPAAAARRALLDHNDDEGSVACGVCLR
jgi:hypothetical protein